MERNKADNAKFLSEEPTVEKSETVVEEVTFEELDKFYFSPGVITWKRKLKLCEAGDILDHKYFLKFRKVSHALPCRYKLYSWNAERFVEFMTMLKTTGNPSKKLGVRNKFLTWFKRVYWEGKSEGSLLDLMEGAHRVFHDLPQGLQEAWLDNSIDLYKVFTLQGALLASFALSLGYTDFKMLKDLYHLPFFFDSALLDNLTYNSIKALNAEWKGESTGLQSLESSNASSIEKSNFENHTLKGSEKVGSFENSFFHFKNLGPLVNRHHERVDGSGFPNKLNWNEMSDIESLIVFVSHNFGSNEVKFDNENTCVFLGGRVDMEICNEKTISPRLESMLIGIFKNLEKDGGMPETGLLGA